MTESTSDSALVAELRAAVERGASFTLKPGIDFASSRGQFYGFTDRSRSSAPVDPDDLTLAWVWMAVDVHGDTWMRFIELVSARIAGRLEFR